MSVHVKWIRLSCPSYHFEKNAYVETVGETGAYISIQAITDGGPGVLMGSIGNAVAGASSLKSSEVLAISNVTGLESSPGHLFTLYQYL